MEDFLSNFKKILRYEVDFDDCGGEKVLLGKYFGKKRVRVGVGVLIEAGYEFGMR